MKNYLIMLTRCLKNLSTKTIIILGLYSCHPTLKSLNTERIPTEVAQHFGVMKYDSSSFVTPEPIKVVTENYIIVYTLIGQFRNGELTGKIEQTKFPTSLPNLPPQEAVRTKPLFLKLKYKLCCSNHFPNDCVNNEKQAEDSTLKKKCNNWKVVIL